MDNDKDKDFTFCQVSAPVDNNGFNDSTVVPGISNIIINEEASSSNNRDQVGLWSNRLPGNSSAVKEEKVGSLSFSVVSAPPPKKSTESSKHVTSSGAGGSIKRPEEGKHAPKKPAPRAKVPFEKGYSQMDWLKLTRTHPDLAGLKGQSSKRLISMSEVKQHQSEGSMWTVLKGHVYNISPYMKFHPGGVDMLMKTIGKDCTSLFSKYHAWVNAEFLLEKCLVGILDETSEKK